MTDASTKMLDEVVSKLNFFRYHYGIGTASLTPVNFEEEREKFFSSATYNPVFKYEERRQSPMGPEVEALEKAILELPLEKEMKEHLLDYVQYLVLLSETLFSIGLPTFPDNAAKLIPLDKNDIAKNLLEPPLVTFTTHPPGGKLFNAKEVKEIFQDVLISRYGITDVQVLIDTFSDRIIRVSDKHVVIGSKIKRYENNVRRIVVHEIESHALQSHNNRLLGSNFVKLFRYKDRMLYSEGLAVYNEMFTKTLTEDAFSSYMLRLQAVSLLPKSFREIFDALSTRTSEKKAYFTTFRVKRGMSDTSLPGGFPKDALYLLGYQHVKKYLADGGSLTSLYASKDPTLVDVLVRLGYITLDKVALPIFHRKDAV